MSVRNAVDEELKLLHELRPLVTAKQEIAVTRISEPQKKVLAARDFFGNLLEVFGQVRDAYSQEVENLRQERTGHAAVLFSTDERLTGPIVTATFRRFVRFISLQNADPIVIGAVGKERFARELPGVDFTFFQLPENETKISVQSELMKHLYKYKQLTFIYGYYKNLIKQDAAQVTIGSDKGGKVEDVQIHYFFEPSLESIVSFFDQNLVALLLEQTASENELARLGSQITAMERADVNISLRLQELVWEERQSTRRERNKKQRERLAGMSLWGT